MTLLESMMRKADKRTYDITRLEEIGGGNLQQHVPTRGNKSGEELVMHACVVARVRDGKISRIEEYLDPAPTTRLR